MAALLQRLAQGEPVALPQGEVEKPPLLAPDAWRNPAYLHFCAQDPAGDANLLCLLYRCRLAGTAYHYAELRDRRPARAGRYDAKTWLRIGGALFATLLALLLIVFVQPWTDSLSGLLAMSLPVLALAAWIAAGSERIAYAGIKIGFTFALAFPQLVWSAD